MKNISQQHIIDSLSTFVKEQILDDNILYDKNTSFSEMGIDSFSVIQIVLFIEREFDVSMTEKDLTPDNLKSIDSLANFTLTELG